MRKHLVYHCYPLRNGVWRKNVEHLRRNWHLFDGHKTVAIATDQRTDSASEVEAALPGCESFVIRNELHRRECASWDELWNRALPHVAPEDAVFAAHAKGVTKPASIPVQKWMALSYTVCLDFWPRAEKLLETFPTCGPFIRGGNRRWWPNSRSTWHYSGSFWWGRGDAILAADLTLDPGAGGWATECWPGTQWPESQAGELFLRGEPLDLYSEIVWRRRIIPEFAKWKTASPSLTV